MSIHIVMEQSLPNKQPPHHGTTGRPPLIPFISRASHNSVTTKPRLVFTELTAYGSRSGVRCQRGTPRSMDSPGAF
ncbi:MAG: hypothetical protein IGQ88_03205 [Gloeomargaritaceae cyanobacterium C42_A2020_066]|nr:hypothetical protein [Gloeomargaritaceae cyanobacterium C42_A2020_066]